MAIRVLEVGDNVAAGYCGRLYAQLGAEVIRIDSPATPAVVSQLAYRCKGDDDWIVIVCRTQLEWESLCRLAHQGWAEALDCATMNKRREHQSELDQAINAWTQGWDKIELMTRLQQHGVPAGAVMTAPEFMGDPHLETRGFFVALGAEHIDPIPYPGLPVLIDGQRGEGWDAAPKLGEHNAEVLQSILGLNPDGVQKLAEQGVLASRPPA